MYDMEQILRLMSDADMLEEWNNATGETFVEVIRDAESVTGRDLESY